MCELSTMEAKKLEQIFCGHENGSKSSYSAHLASTPPPICPKPALREGFRPMMISETLDMIKFYRISSVPALNFRHDGRFFSFLHTFFFTKKKKVCHPEFISGSLEIPSYADRLATAHFVARARCLGFLLCSRSFTYGTSCLSVQSARLPDSLRSVRTEIRFVNQVRNDRKIRMYYRNNERRTLCPQLKTTP